MSTGSINIIKTTDTYIASISDLQTATASAYTTAQMATALLAAQTAIEMYLGYNLMPEQHVDIVEAINNYKLYVDNIPIISGSVTDSSSGAISTVAYDRYFTQGTTSSPVIWNGKYIVSYRSGYTSIPADIQQAAISMCMDMLQQRGPYISETIGNYKYELSDALEYLGRYKYILIRYKRRTCG